MQISLFDGNKPFKITKPIRLIELFAGIGAQAKALENIGADFEHYRICEYDRFAVQSYNAIHGTDFEPSDITKITAKDLAITDTDFDKVKAVGMSDSQCYKQAGNSIVVSVLEAIFKEMKEENT